MMGLVHGKGNKEISEERVPYDENDDNGLILNNHYIPEEVLANILRYVHYKTLAKCMLVCKRWNELIQSYVWRKKSKAILGQLLPADEKIHWSLYYIICKDNSPFGRNLIKNHSGSEGLKKHWKILRNDGDKWAVEEPPLGVPPLPETEPLFAERQTCFVTSYVNCCKMQTVDLLAEGLTSQILDNLQPPIVPESRTPATKGQRDPDMLTWRSQPAEPYSAPSTPCGYPYRVPTEARDTLGSGNERPNCGPKNEIARGNSEVCKETSIQLKAENHPVIFKLALAF
ncbi:F-box only protein 6-like [Belonocnema kinseyi]|uniref:F-box only protein 6-like n=1 Tax=Belonocnema kinseyi TaxID=2817044 RepID=UPI00143D96C0|nr:F-box only protein 6-like [Belonocnema kinseyi]